MAIYTVVDEGYCVDLYRSLKAVTEAMAEAKLYFDDIDESEIEGTELATAKQSAKVLRKESIVRLVEEPGDRDWKYRIEKH
jgi:hypothetical protein